MIIVLATGVEPFGFDPTNPLWDAAQALDNTQVDGVVTVVRQLPCVFGLVNEMLVDTVEATPPVLVFTLGLVTGRTKILVERVAINAIDVCTPDNAGNQPVGTSVMTDGPTAYSSALSTKAIMHAPREAGIPAGVSQSVGTHNCNHLFYGLMHRIAMRAPQVRGDFTHALATPELAARHAGWSSLLIDTQTKGVRLAVRTILATQLDLKMSAGAMRRHVYVNGRPTPRT